MISQRKCRLLLLRAAAIALLVCITASAYAGMLEQMTSDGSIKQVTAPDITDPAEAAAFASKCKTLAEELASDFGKSPEHNKLYKHALLTSEFITGKPYHLKTTDVPSVVKLRELVKAPVPDAVVYVKIYPSKEVMPPFVRQSFKDENIKGVTILGRYVAMLDTEYPKEKEDVLSHEMVHAYLELASPKSLPRWFHEGAAVYFSTGKDRKFYGREAGIPEGKETVLPEEYKNKLFTFNFIAEKAGEEKLFELVRESVRTGEVDTRIVGFGGASSKAKKQRISISPKVIIIGAVFIIGIIFVAAYLSSRREYDY